MRWILVSIIAAVAAMPLAWAAAGQSERGANSASERLRDRRGGGGEKGGRMGQGGGGRMRTAPQPSDWSPETITLGCATNKSVTAAIHTQRPPGSTFMFCVQGDSHPERGSQFDPDLYRRTLLTASKDQPDFYITSGDDFSVDNLPVVNPDTVTARYILQRSFLAQVANSACLYLVNGNHEQATRHLLDSTPNNVAVWAQNSRNRYFAQPAPDGFYTGNPEVVEHIGLLRNYYAWTWGDALFVTLDPYWHSAVPVDNAYGGGAKARDRWQITIGDAQYQWLKTTLEQSKARYKFVFAHHVMGTGRGGVDIADQFEWGGKNPDGTWGFKENRPNWPLPIHQLMAANHVSIFFHGHDHIFVRQELDGVVYQELPEPGYPSYTPWNIDAYRSGVKIPNTGYVRVAVSPENATVEYVRVFLPKDESTTQTTGQVAYRYSLAGNGMAPIPASVRSK